MVADREALIEQLKKEVEQLKAALKDREETIKLLQKVRRDIPL